MKYLGPLFTFTMMFLLVYAGMRSLVGVGVSLWPLTPVVLAGGYVFFYLTIIQLREIESNQQP